jgi:hypothetical protein
VERRAGGWAAAALHIDPSLILYALSPSFFSFLQDGDVYAVHLVARICVSVQMVVSVCYTVVILGQALASTVGFLAQVKASREEKLQGNSIRGVQAQLDAVREEEEDEAEVEVMTLPRTASMLPRSSGGARRPHVGGDDESEPVSTADEYSDTDGDREVIQQQARAQPVARVAPPQPQQQVRRTPQKIAPRAAAPSSASSSSAASTLGAAVGSAQVSASRAAQRASASLEEVAPGAQLQAKVLAARAAQKAGQVAQEVKAGVKAEAKAASQALEVAKPGLQGQVKRQAQTAAAAVKTGAAVATIATLEHAHTAAHNPTVQRAVQKARPVVQQAQRAAQEASRAAEHQRQQSRGMFDPSDAEDDENGPGM